MPDFPDINLDSNPQASFEEIKDLDIKTYKNLFNPELDEVLLILFPEENGTLQLLDEYFIRMAEENNRMEYQEIGNLCRETINRLYSLHR